MSYSFRRTCRWLAIGALLLPLLQMSCVEIGERAAINGFFDAATPLTQSLFQQRLAELFGKSDD